MEYTGEVTTDVAPDLATEPEKFPTIAIACPPEFKAILEEKAKGNQKSTARYCLEVLADYHQFTLPEMRTRGTGVTDEVKKAKAKEASRKQRELVKAVMRAVAAGKFTLAELGVPEDIAA
jgi:hypothetical protein